jgi:hypothetical protein
MVENHLRCGDLFLQGGVRYTAERVEQIGGHGGPENALRHGIEQLAQHPDGLTARGNGLFRLLQRRIERGDAIGAEFVISGTESNIGRWDADNGIFPDIDLDSVDQEAKVSRRHARIIFREGKYFVEDLGSTNGTYVNRGRRLLPGIPQVLADGDEIIVGKTFFRFHISN